MNSIKTNPLLFKYLAWVWATALASIFIMVSVTYIQTKIIKPLEPPSLSITLEKIDKAPQNKELREQYRALDFLARKAFFTSRRQIRLGAILVIVFFLLLAATLKYYRSLTDLPQLPLQVAGMENDKDKTDANLYRAISFTALGTAAFTLVLILSLDRSWLQPLRTYIPKSTAVQIPYKQVWQNFRGPGGLGLAGDIDVPVQWDTRTGENIIWKSPIPKKGFSSPVIWKGNIFLTGADREERIIFCFSYETGKLLWHKAVPDTQSEVKELKLPEEAGFAAPTPAVDDAHVYAMFGTGTAICYTHHGKLKWSRYMGEPDNRYGHSSSLMLHGDILYIQYDHDIESNLFALDKKTGKTIWKNKREEITWSSPVIIPTPQSAALILTSAEAIDAYDAATGAHLFALKDCLSGEVGPSAAFNGTNIFVANEYAMAASISLPWNSGKSTPEIVWQNDDNLPSTSSPTATKDLVFLAAAEGLLTCHSTSDGHMIWEKEYDEGFYASPIIVKDKVYLMDLEGTMQIFKADSIFTQISSPSIGEEASATPAFVDGSIIIRGEDHLYRIGKK